MSKIMYFLGDVTEAPEKIIVHGCNTQGVMGAGVALAIRKKWPDVYEKYKNHCEEYKSAWGAADVPSIICPIPNDQWVFNMMTQPTTKGGHPFSYDMFAHGLRVLTNYAQREDIQTTYVAMPRIGSGLGGGDWEIISKMIERIVPDWLTIVVYDFEVVPGTVYDGDNFTEHAKAS